MKTFITIFLILSMSFFKNLQAQTQVSGHITTNTTWSNAGSPYLVTGNLYIDNGVTLTIPAGVVVKLNYQVCLLVSGVLDVQGTSGSPVVFTSYKDDSYGGDSNGDGNGSQPAAGNWGYIKFTSQANVTNTFDYCIVKYGGYYYPGSTNSPYMLWITSSNTTYNDVMVSNCTFSNAYENAIYIDGQAEPLISNSDIMSSPFGILIKTSFNISAINNYWGDATGPNHTTLNPAGKGCKVSDKVNFSPWATSRINSEKGGEITFAKDALAFSSPVFYSSSQSYIYYYLDKARSTVNPGVSFIYNLSAGNKTIPCQATIMDKAILKIGVDLSAVSEPMTLIFSIPDSVASNGNYYLFKSAPWPFSIQVEKRNVSQSIDVFAGGSLGTDLIAGGVGLGPSVAAASLSLGVTGGFGLNFMHELNGDEYITRRFEASIGLSAETPAINAVVGKIQAGVSAEFSVNGYAAQSMKFPGGLNTSLIQKAKAAYIMEAMTLGNVERSPFAGVFLKACRKALFILNPDLDAIYNDLYHSWAIGTGIEGGISAGINIASGEGDNQIKLNLLDVGGSFAVNGELGKEYQTGDKSYSLSYARGFNISTLNFVVGEFDFGSVYDFKYGQEVTLGADFSLDKGFDAFRFSFKASPSGQILFGNYTMENSYDFLVPRAAIIRSMHNSSLLRSVNDILGSRFTGNKLQIGMNYFTSQIDSLFYGNPDTLSVIDDHVMLEINKTRMIGINAGVNVGLDVVLGVGAGLDLGLQFSYFDELSYTKKQMVFVKGQLLPLVEYSDVSDGFNLFRFRDELRDLFMGTALLLEEPLKELVRIQELVVEAGKSIVLEAANSAYRLAGKISTAGKMIVRVLDPTEKSVYKGLFLEPRVVTSYSSRRIIHDMNKKGSLDALETGAVLYVVSDNVNISLTNNSGLVVSTFDPLEFSLAIDNEKMSAMGFGEEEKAHAKMYYYDAENMVWILIPVNNSTNPNIITSQITRSGSYAVGIEFSPLNDNNPPVILQYYPAMNEIVGPLPTFWAKLEEGPLGAGIDFSRTKIIIDGNEVSAIWDPVNKIISYSQKDTLDAGSHIFSIVAVDLNGNKSELSSTCYYNSKPQSILPATSTIEIDIFPNPASEYVNLSLANMQSGVLTVDVYNQLGQSFRQLLSKSGYNEKIEISWDLTDEKGVRAKPGTYFIRIKNNNNINVKKIVIL